MARNKFVIAAAQCGREVSQWVDHQEVFERFARVDQAVVQVDLRVAEHDGEFGSRKALVARTTLVDLGLLRQVFDFAIQQAGFFEISDQLCNFIYAFN